MAGLGNLLARPSGLAGLSVHVAIAAIAALVFGMPGAFVSLIATFSLDMLRRT